MNVSSTQALNLSGFESYFWASFSRSLKAVRAYWSKPSKSFRETGSPISYFQNIGVKCQSIADPVLRLKPKNLPMNLNSS